MRVLVIDDDRIALEHAEIILDQIGIQCDTAESGWEGIDKVRIQHGRREDYNLILIDWRMPEIDGIETTRQIRSIVGQNTPIIILTSFNWDEIADEAKEAGVDSFVAKPLFAGSVMDEFREAFRRKNESLVKRTVDLKGKRVLLAEDIPVNAEIMMMVLSMREMEAEHAANGREAVEMFESHAPGYYDAILMDMRMPELDGLKATKIIRGMDREDAKTIPIIALTANAFDEDVQLSMQAGLNAHLAKPVEPDALYEILESRDSPTRPPSWKPSRTRCADAAAKKGQKGTRRRTERGGRTDEYDQIQSARGRQGFWHADQGGHPDPDRLRRHSEKPYAGA